MARPTAKLAGLLVALAAVSCTGGSSNGIVATRSPSAAASVAPAAAASPSASPTSSSPSTSPLASPATANPSPTAVASAFGVLVSPLTGATYTVSLIAVDGTVLTSAEASSPAAVSCGSPGAAALPLPISTSNTRVYFMDAAGVVRFLSPSGDTGPATTLPVGGARRSMFAVSPNDQRIAVVVDDFNSSGASTKLYVEDLNGGGNHVDSFNETGAYSIWPIGWHGTSLVVAKTPACEKSNAFGCCGPLELHVVDATTAVRRVTIGGAECLIAGPPSPAGAACETTAIDFKIFGWAGNLTRQEISGLHTQGPAYLSPDGQHIAHSDGATTVLGYSQGSLPMDICGWIDNTHILAGGDTQHQARVGDLTGGNTVPVAAMGTCGGRIPGVL